MASETCARQRVVFLHDADVVPGPVGALAELAVQTDLEIPRHPGFGSADDAAAVAWDSAGDLAVYHLERLRASADGRPVHLIGAGFGGWIAMEMALHCREHLASLTLVCPYGVKLSGPMEPEFADILLLDPDEVVAKGWADPAACHSVRMPGFPPDGDDDSDAGAFAERAALSRYAWKPFLHDPLLARWLHVLDIPALVISGAADGLIRTGHGRALAERLPAARHAELPGAGHYPYLETPLAFLEIVLPFIGAAPVRTAEL